MGKNHDLYKVRLPHLAGTNKNIEPMKSMLVRLAVLHGEMSRTWRHVTLA